MHADPMAIECELEENREYIPLLESLVIEAKNVRKLISRDDHWCLEDCHKCKARDAFDLALNKLENFKFKRGRV